MKNSTSAARLPLALSGPALLLLLAATGCEGDQGPAGPPTPTGPTRSTLAPDEDAPGINVTIMAMTGASGTTFQVGDFLTVRYMVTKDDGSDWDPGEFSRGRILASGPTFNYQRILAEQSDLHTASRQVASGVWEYTFPDPIPATYMAPLNDTTSFGAGDGELAGQALLAGTYTVGMYFGWDYTVDGDSFRDVGQTTSDFLFGGAQVLQPRAVTADDNCNQCHADLQAHGGLRHGVTLCLLCHTAGAEDRNVATAAGGTPGASIEFQVMIHKIHAGSHLPSVLGVETMASGARNYAGTPTPYQLVGFGNNVLDFSHVAFPVWPSLAFPMPRDAGYSALGSTEKGLEDTIRSGPVNCASCHGDPDGAGPLAAPAQGGIAFMQPTRAACGACHDDIDWTLPYQANEAVPMPAQPDDSMCIVCHASSGDSLAVMDGHLHPLNDSAVSPGLNFEIQSVAEAGTNDGDGTLDPGEKVALTFDLTTDAGAPVMASSVPSMTTVVSGPTSNLNLLLYRDIPTAALMGSPPYSLNLPMDRYLELAGTSSAALESFTTAFTPHWNVSGAMTSVWRRSAGGTAVFLDGDVAAPSNFIDVDDASGFARDDFIVVDDGMAALEEYLQVQWVDGNRLWFSSPYQIGSENGSTIYKHGTEVDHASGATVQTVTLDLLAEGTDYDLEPTTGRIDELIEFGAGADVVVSYTTDFVVPATYPLALNDGEGLGEVEGQWRGKSLVSGTYRVGLWGYENVSVTVQSETTSYRAASTAVEEDVLVGDATTLEPYDLISGEANCLACHQDIYFHGGTRRGFVACLQCHGNAGSEDRPRYRAPNAPPTDGLSIQFREMLHAIHMGEELDKADEYEVVGFGLGYPDNYSTASYEEVVFPPLPGGPRHCEACHGNGNTAWQMPHDLEHPSEPGEPTRTWGGACGACHDSDLAQAHIASQTPTGFVEACIVCHGVGKPQAVEVVHKPR